MDTRLRKRVLILLAGAAAVAAFTHTNFPKVENVIVTKNRTTVIICRGSVGSKKDILVRPDGAIKLHPSPLCGRVL